MSRSGKLAKNVTFITSGNIGSKLVGFIMLPFYTTWLSPADYGITDLLGVYANLMLNIVACDISDAIYIFPVGAPREKVIQYYSTGFFFQVFCSIICLVIFGGLSLLDISGTFGQNTWYIYGILISALFQKYTQDFCRGINKMSVFSYTGIIQTGAVALFSFLFIPRYGVYGFVVATILSNILSALFTFVYSRSYQYLSLEAFDKAALSEMLKFSIPLIPTAIMWWLISGLNRPLLETYVGLFALGLIAVSGKLPGVMSMVFNFFQQAWIVTVVEEYKKPDFSRYFNNMFQMVIAVQVAVCFLIIVHRGILRSMEVYPVIGDFRDILQCQCFSRHRILGREKEQVYILFRDSWRNFRRALQFPFDTLMGDMGCMYDYMFGSCHHGPVKGIFIT